MKPLGACRVCLIEQSSADKEPTRRSRVNPAWGGYSMEGKKMGNQDPRNPNQKPEQNQPKPGQQQQGGNPKPGQQQQQPGQGGQQGGGQQGGQQDRQR